MKRGFKELVNISAAQRGTTFHNFPSHQRSRNMCVWPYLCISTQVPQNLYFSKISIWSKELEYVCVWPYLCISTPKPKLSHLWSEWYSNTQPSMGMLKQMSKGRNIYLCLNKCFYLNTTTELHSNNSNFKSGTLSSVQLDRENFQKSEFMHEPMWITQHNTFYSVTTHSLESFCIFWEVFFSLFAPWSISEPIRRFIHTSHNHSTHPT